MCELKPGPRCATDTRAQAQAAVQRYHAAYPAGPPVDPLGTVRSIYQVARTAYRVAAPVARVVSGPIRRDTRALMNSSWLSRQMLATADDAKRARREVAGAVRAVRAARR